MIGSLARFAAAHRRLEGEVRREAQRRLPDTLKLLRLKKLRLAIKDRLHRLAPLGTRSRA